MIPLLLFFAAFPDDAQALAHCVERADHACVQSLLAKNTHEQSPEYLAVAARAELLLGNRQNAVAAIDRAVEQKPGDFDLLMEQGWVHQKSGDQVAAIRSFLTAGKLQPRVPAVFYELRHDFFLLHEFDRSVTHFQKVLELDPKHDKAEFMLGILDVLRNREADARSHLQRALALSPSNPHYLLHYGVLLMQLNEPQEALANMRQAEQIDASNPLTHFNLGRLYRQMDKLPEAEKELRETVRLRPELARAYYQLASVYREQGRPTDAAAALEKFSKFKDQDRADDPIDATLSK